jgi:putative aminopeptidase FrvX
MHGDLGFLDTLYTIQETALDADFLKRLTEAPAVGTACGPVVRLLSDRFGSSYERTLVPDGFCLFRKRGGPTSPPLAGLQTILVAHMDEIGGCVYGARKAGGFDTRFWGNTPEIFRHATLQGMDYLEEDPANTFPVIAQEVAVGDEVRLSISGDHVRPYRTVWTFAERTTIRGDVIEGKALDPRVTLYAVVEAIRKLDSPAVGALLVMAEECAMEVARKALIYLARHAPDLRLIANADVPWIGNLGEGRLDMPAIRIYEGRNFVDPSFGIRASDILKGRGVEHHLSAARSGSQTVLFTPLAPTLSVALPSDGVHLPRVKMSVQGTERCVALLTAIGELGMSDDAFAAGA